jgi:hypothetical protein
MSAVTYAEIVLVPTALALGARWLWVARVRARARRRAPWEARRKAREEMMEAWRRSKGPPQLPPA